MTPTLPGTESLDGFILAGPVGHRGLNLSPSTPPTGRVRHAFGDGPFAKLVMPKLPTEPGLYACQIDDAAVVYLGQTRTPLAKRLGPQGYATISTYNTRPGSPVALTVGSRPIAGSTRWRTLHWQLARGSSSGTA